jgi:hypothetical protein
MQVQSEVASAFCVGSTMYKEAKHFASGMMFPSIYNKTVPPAVAAMRRFFYALPALQITLQRSTPP